MRKRKGKEKRNEVVYYNSVPQGNSLRTYCKHSKIFPRCAAKFTAVQCSISNTTFLQTR